MAELLNKALLETLYKRYNKRCYLMQDPVLFLHRRKWAKRDAEIVGLICSSLAVGRVQQILKSADRALNIMGENPYDFLMNSRDSKMSALYSSFTHRFFGGSHIVSLLCSIKKIIKSYGSLNRAFSDGIGAEDTTLLSALEKFTSQFQPQCGSLIPSPSSGSACKRLLLFLRWMVRKDAVDVGVWYGIKPSLLIVPLDTHMFRIGKRAGIIKNKNANMKAAEEFTAFLRNIDPEDPVKYDFALSHAGMDGLL
jgi:uncharacterized protein (TIGR02757 family)